MQEPLVILVDENDNTVGTMPKMEAHQKGMLHRAVSVFLFNSKGEFLLQQRAFHKYHSVGLWTNTCCSHPYPNESNKEAAERRLFEEMGMKVNLTYLFQFIYKTDLDKNLTEHELDHVFVGYSDDIPKPNADEVNTYKYLDFKTLSEDVKKHPENYTVWFKIIFEKVNDLRLT